ncbi:M16 family metallopeptidase [Andreprevotia chitinilytica]|uniref:M16 family metallopeptidase n=1 Tax=Andreprevotia chitinilytica TaxID=396808 RepID=UPI00068CB881|nr:pitrilysin family protein [Andreprevotia chitinilytica]
MNLFSSLGLAIALACTSSAFAGGSGHKDAPATSSEASAPSATATPIATAPAPVAAPEALLDTTLDNGLRVVIQPDHRAPIAMVQMWYRVGSIDEPTGKSGLSHLLEHMMFKGTPTVPAGQFSFKTSKIGGYTNAATTQDYTYYYNQLPAAKLPEVLALEADRMQHLTFDPELFKREKAVVEEERHWRVDDNSWGEFTEKLAAATLKTHPYRNPVLGWPAEFDTITLDDTRNWYQAWYAPNNAVLVILGDVNPQAALAEAKKQFGAIAAKTLPERVKTDEPAQTKQQKLTIPVPADRATVVLRWRVPTLTPGQTDRRPYTLMMLANMLNNDPYVVDSRLSDVADEVGALYDSMGRSFGEFTVWATPSKGKSAEDVASAMLTQASHLRSVSLHQENLDNGKLNWAASQAFSNDKMSERATAIGQRLIYGFPANFDLTELAEIQKVTLNDIENTADQLLDDNTVTVGILQPTPRDPKAKKGAIHVR